MLEPEDYLVGPDGSFDRDLYDLRPELFTSYFHVNVRLLRSALRKLEPVVSY